MSARRFGSTVTYESRRFDSSGPAAEVPVPLGVELDSDPLLHYSARQDVLIWPLAPA